MIHRVPEGGWLKWGLNLQIISPTKRLGFHCNAVFFQFHTRWVLYIRRTGIHGLTLPRWEWGWL